MSTPNPQIETLAADLAETLGQTVAAIEGECSSGAVKAMAEVLTGFLRVRWQREETLCERLRDLCTGHSMAGEELAEKAMAKLGH